MDVLGGGIKGNSSFAVNIFFEAAGKPEIKELVSMSQGRGHTALM
jgi:hypothetical protein